MARRKLWRNAGLLLLAAAIVLLPLVVPQLEGASFAGADGRVQALIEGLAPDYRPWAAPPWAPPGTETEGLLFALQAALGAGVLGYCLGLRRGKRAKGGGAAQDDAGDERD